MKLYFLKESALESLKKNIHVNIQHYNNPTNEWIYDFFDGENPFSEFKFEVDDFELDISSESILESNINNIKILYDNLKFLTDSQASDERFWAGLTHGQFWSYMQHKINSQNLKVNENFIVRRFFINYSSKKFYELNFLARLWWIARITYDENRENPYELTEYLLNSGFNIQTMFSSSFVNNKQITKAVLSACRDFENNNFSISNIAFLYILKYLNLLGGKYILDYFEEKELYDILTKELVKITSNPNEIVKYKKNKNKNKINIKTSLLKLFSKK